MVMKPILFLSIALLISACGSGLNSYHSEGLEVPGMVDGVLTLPSAGVASGRSYINTANVGFYIDLSASSPEVISYLYRLESHEIQVSRTEVAGSELYRVRFTGSQDQGPCPFNSSSTCTRIQLQSLVAY